MTTADTALRIPCRTPQDALHLTALLAEEDVPVLKPEGRDARVHMPRTVATAAWVLTRAVDAGLARRTDCEVVLARVKRARGVVGTGGGR